MRTSTWKRAELEVAARLGGTRVPVSGRQRGDQPDIKTGPWSVEVKHTKARGTGLIEKALQQAEAARRGDQLAVAVIHKHGTDYDSSLVVVRLKDFAEWYGNPETEDAA